MSQAKTFGAADRPQSISALEAHLGFWLRFVSNHVSARFQKLVEANGVSVSDWVALRLLFGGTAGTHLDLMNALGMTKGAVSKIVTRLSGKGLIERVPSETDGRAQQIVITSRGRALVPRLAALADQNDEAFFGHLTPDQRSTLMDAMKLLVREHQLKHIPVD